MLGVLPPSTDMAGYYQLEGNSNDLSGNGNNGTDANITYGLAYGKFGQGASCNGTTSSIIANGLLTTLATSTTGTISFWFNTQTSASGSRLCMYIKNDLISITRFYIQQNWAAGTKYIIIALQIDGTIQWNYHSAANTLTTWAGTWHNMVIVQDGVAPKFYMDGSLLTMVATTTTNTTKWFKALITDAISPISDTEVVYTDYLGNIDEIVFMKTRAWTAKEVKKHYSQYKGFF